MCDEVQEEHEIFKDLILWVGLKNQTAKERISELEDRLIQLSKLKNIKLY